MEMKRNIAVPKRRAELKKRIVEWVQHSRLGPGDGIPSQVKLAELFKTTELTVHRALTELAQEGVVERIKGKGTFVGAAAVVQRAAGRHIALVLPGEGLDRPENNPEYWPYVQMILRCFISYAGSSRVFSPRAVTSRECATQVAEDLRGAVAAFFLYQKDEWGLFDRLVQERIAPVVCLGLPHADRPCLSVDHDRVNGARLGVLHLIRLGYRRIGFVGSREYWGQMSYEGYRQALDEARLAAKETWSVRIGESRAEGSLGAARLQKQAPECDAVFADSDIHALGVLDHLRAVGVRVPEDIGVMGYDGLDLAVAQPPHLASVRVPWERIIGAAMDELAQHNEPSSPIKHISVLGEVVTGRTLRQGRKKPLREEKP